MFHLISVVFMFVAMVFGSWFMAEIGWEGNAMLLGAAACLAALMVGVELNNVLQDRAYRRYKGRLTPAERHELHENDRMRRVGDLGCDYSHLQF